MDLLEAWLIDRGLANGNGNYRLRLWCEDRAALDDIQEELAEYVDEALDDARGRIRRGFEDSLSPFNDPANDPAANFPKLLNRITLQGYFGEILAAIAIEHWGAQGNFDWFVPAFLFRTHDQEFQHLESINERIMRGEDYEPDDVAERRPGRTGDDCLAFRIDDQDSITDVIMIEAKCLTANNPAKMSDAHSKFSATENRLSGVRELVNLLSDYEAPEAQRWQTALLRLWQERFSNAARYDGVLYACAQAPVRGTRVAWMPADAAHADYTGGRFLEGLEFQFEELAEMIDRLFRGA